MKKIVIASIATITVASSLFAGAVPPACFGCHGKDGEKNIMAKDAVPNKLSKAEIVTALEGYKAGTLNKFGKGMIMKGQSAHLTDAQIKDIAAAWAKK